MNAVAQLFQFLAWVLLITSYWKDDSKKIIYLQLFSGIFYALGYFLLGAYSGLVVIIFEILRDFLYFKTNKQKSIFNIFIPIYILGCILTYQNPVDILPYLTSLYDGYILTKKRNIILFGSYITYTLWIIYNINCKAYVSAITESIIIISNTAILLYNFTKYLRRKNITVSKCKIINDEILNEINLLDKKYLWNNLRWSREQRKIVSDAKDNTLLLVKDDNKIIGYINIIFITKKKWNDMIKSDIIVDDFKINEISFKSTDSLNYLNINSIVVRPGYQNSNTTRKIIEEIKNYLNNLENNGYKIGDVLMICTSEYEDTVLKKLKSHKLKELDNGAVLYNRKREI